MISCKNVATRPEMNNSQDLQERTVEKARRIEKVGIPENVLENFENRLG